jgi:hypothetical protein
METTVIQGINMWLIIKIFALVLLAMYLIFALVVVRQVKLMTDTLHLGGERLVRTLSVIHLAFAVLVILAAFVIL